MTQVGVVGTYPLDLPTQERELLRAFGHRVCRTEEQRPHPPQRGRIVDVTVDRPAQGDADTARLGPDLRQHVVHGR